MVSTCCRLWVIGCVLVWGCFLSRAGLAQPGVLNLPPEPEVPKARAAVHARSEMFRIAYLQGGDEIPLGRAGFARLRRYLEADWKLSRALRAAGYARVEMVGTDSYTDLIQRMSATEFDLVFPPALVYVSQKGDYKVLAQVFDPTRHRGRSGRMGVFQTPVIFVNRRNPLFGESDQVSAERVRAVLASKPMAVISASSAVGYVYPLLALHDVFKMKEPPPLVWCGSSDEVVKAVINDLVEVGACDEASLDRVMKTYYPNVSRDEIVHIIARRPDPLPTAPVVVWAPLHPSRGTELGRTLSEVLQDFFRSEPGSRLRLEPADERVYAPLREEVERFYQIRGKQ